ncbi:hypothetical protein WICPIJ_008958 [Wickerhamomyces pijperi]|uniref:Actin patches distal protein 1 n=1 Tax=Wickerhamomyces pijperi TaxID=599730 RepID=A0A9P8PSG4_WICPI|nr:hypothetical protein WICPIJ_008958 [Wickerhamomyces pijperi]
MLKSLISKFTEDPKIKRDEEISKSVPLSDCSSECDSCTAKFPASVKIEDGDIYNSSKPTSLHFVVPTGKTDWAHDATSTANTVENQISKWIEKKSSKIVTNLNEGSVKVSTSSLPFDSLDPRCYDGSVNDVLILPYFIWLRKIDVANVDSVLGELVPALIKSREETLPPPTEIQGYKIEPSNAHSYVFLCSHKTRDKRCGITAPIMKKEMDFRLRDTGHYRDFGDDSPDGVFVQFINHVGGHKFSANVIVYLRTGEIIWLAKCNPLNARPIIDETVLGGGKVWGDLVRVVQKSKGIQW